MKNTIKINPKPANLDLNIESERLLAEFGEVVVTAQKQPKDAVFDFLLRTTSEETLSYLLEGMAANNRQEGDHPSMMLVVLAALSLRSYLQGDKKGGFEATDSEMTDIVNTLHPYWLMEFARRRHCFGVFGMPENPWAFNATVRLAEPNRSNIERTVAELEKLGLPCPPPLVDEDLVSAMESQNIGVEIQMPVQGRMVASEEMLNIQPHKLPPVDPEKFIEVFSEINQAAFNPEPMPDLNIPDVDLFKKNGKVQTLSGKDSPEIRIIRIINERFRPDYEQCQSATARIFAFTALLRSNALDPLIRKSPDRHEMPTQVLIVASTMKLTKGGSFPPVRFVQEVERLMKQ